MDGQASQAENCLRFEPTSLEAQQYLDAALGWLDLGNWREASEELERLPPELRAAPQVLVLRCRIYAQAGRWQDVEMIAEGGAATYPQNHMLHMHRAWTRHMQGDTLGGVEVLTPAAARFPRSLAVVYAMACMCGALNRREEAKQWLRQALDLASNREKIMEQALAQRELFFLWEEGFCSAPDRC